MRSANMRGTDWEEIQGSYRSHGWRITHNDTFSTLLVDTDAAKTTVMAGQKDEKENQPQHHQQPLGLPS
jgi:hypothetical protein